MNRRGLSIDNINQKYRSTSLIDGYSYVKTTASPVSITNTPIIQKPIVKSTSPIEFPLNRNLSPSLPIVQTAIVAEPRTTTIIEQGQKPLIPVSRKVQTVREVTAPTYKISEQIRDRDDRVGVGQYSGYQSSQPIYKSKCHCPWWLWLLILLPVLGLFSFGISKLLSKDISKPSLNIEKSFRESEDKQVNNKVIIDSGKCSPGFFFHNGNCMKCPPGSGWNTTHCVSKKIITTTLSRTSEVDPSPSLTYGSSLKSASLSSSSNLFSGSGLATSSLSRESSSSSITGSKTIGEQMKKLGLDYEGFRKKVDASGGLDSLLNQQQGSVVAPIFDKSSSYLRQSSPN